MFDDAINDLRAYNAAMRKTLQDKAFFLPLVDASLFVDVGCADGSLIQYLKQQEPESHFIGYDISPRERVLALQRLGDSCSVTGEWRSVERAIFNHDEDSAVICSSLIHEVYAYGSQESIDSFWKNLLGTKARYIVIRDMCLNPSANRAADSVNVARIRKAANPSMLADFEAIWGSIDNQKNMLHFLLKYRYVKNWAREVRENYLPLTYPELLQRVSGYRVEYAEQFTLPFLRKSVQKDFGVDIQDTTHVKLVFAKQ